MQCALENWDAVSFMQWALTFMDCHRMKFLSAMHICSHMGTTWMVRYDNKNSSFTQYCVASLWLMFVVSSETMAKRPASAVGRRRPVCEYAQKAALLSGSFRFKVSFCQWSSTQHSYKVSTFHYITVHMLCVTVFHNFNKYSFNIFVPWECRYWMQGLFYC